MSKEVITFGNNEAEKQKFHQYKDLIFLKDLDIDNLLISKNISFEERNYNK